MRFMNQFKGLTITDRGRAVVDTVGMVGFLAGGYGLVVLLFGVPCAFLVG